MSAVRILVTQVAYDLGKDVFDSSSNGLSFEAAPEEETSLATRIQETAAFGVVVAGGKYQGPLYASLPRGGIIARFGVGHDGIHVDLARKHGIYLTNAPGALDQSVAENAIFLLGSLARNIPEHNEALHAGKWSARTGIELCGTTLSVIGFGRIGRSVAEIAARGFRMEIVACDVGPYEVHREFVERLSADSGVQVRYTQSIPEALRAGHFSSLHMPITEATRGIIGIEELAMMPRGSFLINTARGAIVDEKALFDALDSGHLAGAGLDAFTNEPYDPVDPARDLRKLPHVIMTPHMSSSTHAAVRNIAEMCVANIRALLENRIADMTTY